ncbi:MAG: MaoC family dehydratase N-terminal domain-containing protein [Pseudomonadota bacterium]
MYDDEIDLNAWIGREVEETGEISTQIANMLGATLDPNWSVGTGAPGSAAPLLWHWAAFPLSSPMSALARDGHPSLGDFLPPVPLERRMWAGGALRFLKPLHIGEQLTRCSRIAAITEKPGATGDMVFVTVEHEVSGRDGLAIEERQDIVYLAIPPEFRPPKAIPAPERPDHVEPMEVSEARLFRYSAATFNAHRIHYDLPYATEVENYPGLVVHGPLQATLLIETATRWRGAAPDAFSFRGVHPMFHTDAPQLTGVAEDGAMRLATVAGDHQCLQAKAEWSS